MKSLTLLGCLSALLLSSAAAAQTDVAQTYTVEDRMEWFRNAKCGMYIHFGVHRKSEFNPVDSDAGQWVRIAKEGGMKYMVITAKHHDGFCLFDTDATDYNVMDATPFKCDIIKELSEECAKQGIKFGVYYSQFKDWYTNRRTKHTDIWQSENAGRHALPQAVTGE